jgi:zinc protease
MSLFTRVGFASLALATTAAAQREPVKLPARPDVPPPKAFAYPKAVLDSLPNGLRFAVIENHEIPLVVVQTTLAGTGPLGISHLDAPGKAGEIGLMLASLREGTTTRSQSQIDDEVLDLGTDMRFTPTVNGSFTSPGFVAPRSTWKPSLALLADVLMNPTFPEASVEKVRSQLSIAMDRFPAVSILNRVVYGRLFGVESANNQFATSATLAGVTRDDIVAARNDYLRPQNLTVVLVGDVTLKDAKAALASAFGAWPRGGKTVPPIVIPSPAAPAATTIYLKDNPRANLAYMDAGQLVPGRDSRDAAAVSVLSSLLGNFTVSTGSRVYTAFRTERGLSYGPNTLLQQSPYGEAAPLVLQASVPVALMDTAVLVTLKVVRDLRQDRPATASEVEFAKSNLIGRLPGANERLESIATTTTNALRDRLPADYLNNWIQRVGSLTLADVQAAAARYLDPDHLAIVIVGDRAKLEAPLRATGIPVVIVDR